ncbi:lipase member M-like [Paroedura picta]|uniref:lipase member M-like n=1 Tax=Paroedura picta TaxID=143630 RepID=UPI0040568210
MWCFFAIACLIQATVTLEELLWNRRYENPEVHMNVSQVISFRGYPCEEYEVLTDDAYYLTINRIPYGRKNLKFGGPKPVILLQHGIFGEASHWVENMANNSFGFILADAGYDVWLGNSRGSSWSQRHQNYSTDDDEFWDFSFHEMAMYDLPATINFILQKTQQKQLYYVGYSQGASIGFIAFSAMPELSGKIKMFFALAPVISLKHASSPTLKLLRPLSQNSIERLFDSKKVVIWKKPMRQFIIRLCSNPWMKNICGHLLLSQGGFNATNLNMSRMDVYAARFPDVSSLKNLIHWHQVAKSNLFRHFNYDIENQAKYNKPCPPLYEIEDMTVPTAIWSGGNDLVADTEDMNIFVPRIRKLLYHHNIIDWNHWDFIWGLNAPQRMYYKIIKFMGKSL